MLTSNCNLIKKYFNIYFNISIPIRSSLDLSVFIKMVTTPMQYVRPVADIKCWYRTPPQTTAMLNLYISPAAVKTELQI